MPKEKIFICCNGCGRRALDASKLKNYFELNNYKIIKKPKNADYIIFVTCAFIKSREEESFRLITKLNRYNGRLIAVGCLPEITQVKLKQTFKGKTIATKNLHEIDQIFKNCKVKFSNTPDAHFPFLPLSSILMILSTQFRFSKSFYQDFLTLIKNKIIDVIKSKINPKKLTYYMRISHGCLGNCTYCITRKAIGRLKNKPLDICLEEYKEALDKGYKDFAILADDVGSYGLDINSSFSELLNKLSTIDKNINTTWYIKELRPIWAIKYKSELVKMIKGGKIRCILCAVQSGSNRILSLMNRFSDSKKIITTLKEFRKANHNLGLLTQIIVGFPSETNNDFLSTLNLIKKIKFDEVTLYAYSDREGTVASELNNKVDEKIIRKRLKTAIKFLRREGIRYYCDEV